MSSLITSNYLILTAYVVCMMQFRHSCATFAPNPEKPCNEEDILQIFERLGELQNRIERTRSTVARLLTEEMEKIRAETNEQFANLDAKLTKLIKSAGDLGETIEEESFVPKECLECLCRTEQGSPTCRVPSPTCLDDPDLFYCGPYNIDEFFWADAIEESPDLQTVAEDFRECVSTLECSNKLMNGYMKRYANEEILGHAPTCEDISRIHKGGPNGYREAWTQTYASQVTDCLSSLD